MTKSLNEVDQQATKGEFSEGKLLNCDTAFGAVKRVFASLS
jgi:hypothetical protein